METLRIEAPVDSTTYLVFSEDTRIGDITIRKDDELQVYTHGVHFNANEWQKPYEFIPERFDNSNPISLTKDGKKRHPTSWAPFAGGKRVCLGKTFAESVLKITAIYLSQYFNLELVDKKYQTEFPIAHFGMSRRNKVEVILTKYEK